MTPDWEGELLIWPPYDVGAVAAGRLSEREGGTSGPTTGRSSA